MALDRQKILNELGSVMNQLKSTDCGCMGKLFGDSGQNMALMSNTSACNGYRDVCCHAHSYVPTVSNTFSNNTPIMHTPCIGQCNPPKLYADTYNYLNENLMQPTINEVYNDLKTITPANTVMNSPMANQLGFSNKQLVAQNNVQNAPAHFNMGDKNKMNGVENYTRANMMPNQMTANLHQNQMSKGGMGPQIMNMLGDNQSSNQTNMKQQNHLYPKMTDMQQYPNNQIGDSPTISYNNKNLVSGNQIYHSNQSNPQPHFQSANKCHCHGQHTQGIAKFKEMFPGVMQGDDLGFDPMSIAIQMNPENQKQLAMNTEQKMMNNNTGLSNTSDVCPNNNISSNNHNNIQPQPISDAMKYKENKLPQNIASQELTPIANMYGTANPSLFGYNNQQMLETQGHQALTNSTRPTIYDNSINSPFEDVAKMTTDRQKSPMKEPIFPADKSNFVMTKQRYEYNTLGQPVEMLPAKFYHIPEPGLPQTLSPQSMIKSRYDPLRYSNVKSTTSKTSLMDIRPAGKTPSRNQLQHIYNNYRGSHSYTQQNVSPTRKEGTHSDRQLNISNRHIGNEQVERIAGDSLANNEQNQNEMNRKVEQVIGQIGDAPIAYKSPDNIQEKIVKGSPVINRKFRNGLQDITYTSYPTSAAWSFHGDGRTPRPTGRY